MPSFRQPIHRPPPPASEPRLRLALGDLLLARMRQLVTQVNRESHLPTVGTLALLRLPLMEQIILSPSTLHLSFTILLSLTVQHILNKEVAQELEEEEDTLIRRRVHHFSLSLGDIHLTFRKSLKSPINLRDTRLDLLTRRLHRCGITSTLVQSRLPQVTQLQSKEVYFIRTIRLRKRVQKVSAVLSVDHGIS